MGAYNKIQVEAQKGIAAEVLDGKPLTRRPDAIEAPFCFTKAECKAIVERLAERIAVLYSIDIGTYEKGMAVEVSAFSLDEAFAIARMRHRDLFVNGANIVQAFTVDRDGKKTCVFDYMNGAYA